jgi:large subunit ribosomal protein L23
MGIFDKFIGNKKTDDKTKQVKIAKKKATLEKESVLKPKNEKISTLKAKTEMTVPEAGQVATSKKLKKDVNGGLAYKILVKPLITEKATNLVSLNKYVFKVASKANKIEIKKAIKSLYGFEPVSINIINERGKRVTSGRISGKKSNWKKAIVTLKQGDKLEIYEGV